MSDSTESVEVRLRSDGPSRYVGRGVSARDTSATHSVSVETAEYLVEERGYFDYAEGDADADGEEVEDTDDDLPDLEALLSMTVPEVREYLETGEYDQALSIIGDYEAGGADRMGVHRAIEARREADADDGNEE